MNCPMEEHASSARCLWCITDEEWSALRRDHPVLIDKLAERIDWEPPSSIVFTLDGQEV